MNRRAEDLGLRFLDYRPLLVSTRDGQSVSVRNLQLDQTESIDPRSDTVQVCRCL